MNDKRKRKKPFDLFGEEFEKIFEEMQRMIDDSFLEPFEEIGKPFVRGFSVRVGPDGKPHIQEFGNRPSRTPTGDPQISEEREPLTDVMEGESSVSVTMEIPGVEKEDINLEVAEDTLEIKVDTNHHKYHKLLDLPCEVKPESTKATYKNGILDVEIDCKRKKEKKGYKIDIK
jgi:HSP20 family protein